MTRMLKRSLEATGRFEVTTVNHAPDAFSTCQEIQPDLVLLDVMMPEMDGGDVAALIREDYELQQTPIIFLTAVVTREDVSETGGEISGNTFLAKPIKTAELIVAIEGKLA